MLRRLTAGLALAALSATTATAGASDDHLSAAAAAMAKRPVSVQCARLPVGNAGLAELTDAGWRITLAPDECGALAASPRVLSPRYPSASSGEAVFTFAHEVGHVVDGPNPGVMAESHADCYAARHFTSAALLVGYARSDLSALRAQAPLRCWR
jgi:hypothetical protein